jgi:hypothetical protein
VQAHAEGIGYAWYTAPATFVNQLTATHGTIAAATWLHDRIDEVLERERAEVDRAGGLLIVHDWRVLTGYDTDARRVFLERMRRRRRGYLRHAVAVVPPTPLLRMAAQTVNLAMALHSGGKLELATDPAPALAKLGVRAPTIVGWR